jgi:hypothetical protein
VHEAGDRREAFVRRRGDVNPRALEIQPGIVRIWNPLCAAGYASSRPQIRGSV